MFDGVSKISLHPEFFGAPYFSKRRKCIGNGEMATPQIAHFTGTHIDGPEHPTSLQSLCPGNGTVKAPQPYKVQLASHFPFIPSTPRLLTFHKPNVLYKAYPTVNPERALLLLLWRGRAVLNMREATTH